MRGMKLRVVSADQAFLFPCGGMQVHHIHHMMAVLLFFKTLSVLFEAVRFHYYQINGSAEGWSIVYYIFAFIKGVM